MSRRDFAHLRRRVEEHGVNVQLDLALGPSGEGWHQGPTGLLFAVANVPGLPQCVGIVQYRWVPGDAAMAIDYVYAWTHPELRRAGILTAIHSQLRELYPRHEFRTAGSSGKASECWLMREGFEELVGGWCLAPREMP